MYWRPEQFPVSGSGSHTLKWRYVKDSEYEAGDERGSVDYLQWSGSTPPDPTNWDTITYTYDPAGRRIKKNVDDSCMVKYVYDGGHVIAEYADSGLLRKYIYGARVDEPVCMIDVADSNAAYYYHFDGLGSVVALSDSDGDSCQSYEYSVYGQVAASDPNFLSNPYMFTGRRFDIETGLYYYRARYFNPHIGRFMQTDPVGYGAGINWYLYCGNNPLGRTDHTGLEWVATGNAIIIPNFINVPGEILPADLVGVSIGVGSLISAFSCPEGVAMGVAYQAFNILTAAQMVSSTSMYLRPFIEVVDYEDKDGDGVFDPGEPINKTKWVEVIGVFRIEDRENNMYVPGSGYSPTSWLAAIYGTLLAQEYYPLEAPDENRAQMTDPDTYWTWGAEFWLLSDIFHDNDIDKIIDPSMTNIGMPALCPIHWVPWGMCPN